MSGQDFRQKALAGLTANVGVYVLLDLDGVPVYVGQSKDSIRGRVQRHLTSARSDIIANRQIDIWEIAFVWAYELPADFIDTMEAFLFHHFNDQQALMNGKIPERPAHSLSQSPEPDQIIQVLPDALIQQRKEPSIRLPRQAQHYCAITDYYLNIKQSEEVARALDAHFRRLVDNHSALLEPLYREDDAEE